MKPMVTWMAALILLVVGRRFPPRPECPALMVPEGKNPHTAAQIDIELQGLCVVLCRTWNRTYGQIRAVTVREFIA